MKLAIYQSKSYARNNLIFSQSMSISIPFNPTLRAGQMLNLKTFHLERVMIKKPLHMEMNLMMTLVENI